MLYVAVQWLPSGPIYIQLYFFFSTTSYIWQFLCTTFLNLLLCLVFLIKQLLHLAVSMYYIHSKSSLSCHLFTDTFYISQYTLKHLVSTAL